jgi:hypothetical protein
LGPDGEEWCRRNRSWAVEHFSLLRQAERLREVLVRATSGPA